MENAKRIRIVKRGAAAAVTAAGAGAAAAEKAARPEREARRETREVVSDWVRDHKRRADEFRENYSALLDRLGFTSPVAAARRA
jgi:sugar (pentulose or hexulose) kinase